MDRRTVWQGNVWFFGLCLRHKESSTTVFQCSKTFPFVTWIMQGVVFVFVFVFFFVWSFSCCLKMYTLQLKSTFKRKSISQTCLFVFYTKKLPWSNSTGFSYLVVSDGTVWQQAARFIIICVWCLLCDQAMCERACDPYMSPPNLQSRQTTGT